MTDKMDAQCRPSTTDTPRRFRIKLRSRAGTPGARRGSDGQHPPPLDHGFRQVQLADTSPQRWTLHGPFGVRVEGLDFDTLVAVLRGLSS